MVLLLLLLWMASSSGVEWSSEQSRAERMARLMMRPGRLEVSGLRWMGSGQGRVSTAAIYCTYGGGRKTQNAARSGALSG